MTQPNEGQIVKRIEFEVVVGRKLTTAELNIRRVIGVTVLSALVGSVTGIFFPMERLPQKFNEKATGLNLKVTLTLEMGTFAPIVASLKRQSNL